MPEATSPAAVASPAGSARTARIVDALHATLVALLIGTRPLVWDDDPVQVPAIAWLALVLAALGVVVAEGWAGRRPAWRWSWSGIGLAALALLLLPAAAISPLPAQGWGLWSAVAGHVGLAAYLMQVVPGRERIAVAALGAGLLGACAVAVLQWLWVLPGMAQAQLDGRFAALGGLQGPLAERIANGGLFGTFTTANVLATYLLIAVPPLLAAVCARGLAVSTRLAGLLLAALALAAFAGTASKGAFAALAVAGAAVCWWHVRGKRRWLAPAAVAILALGAFAVPGLREGLARSAEVRVGYWSAAVELAAERPLLGHGLRGFGEQAPRALPLSAEYSAHAHHAPLEVAAEAGIAAGLLLLVLLLAMPLRVKPSVPSTEPQETSSPPHRSTPWLLGAGVLYLALLGAMGDNIGWWPGGDTIGGTIGWSALLATAMALAFAALRALPPPPAWAWALALLAAALHACLDFGLHAGGVAGTLVAVAVIAGGAAAPTRPVPRAVLAAASVLLILAAVAWVAGALAANDIRRGRAIVDDVQALTTPGAVGPEDAPLVARRLCAMADLPEPSSPDHMRRLLPEAIAVAMQLARADYELRARALALTPPGAWREPHSAALVAERPASGAAWGSWAYDARARAMKHEREGDGAGARRAVGEAIERMRRSTALVPANLRARRALSTLLEEAASLLPPAEADAARAEATTLRAEIARLRPLVDPRNRDE